MQQQHLEKGFRQFLFPPRANKQLEQGFQQFIFPPRANKQLEQGFQQYFSLHVQKNMQL